MKNILNYAAILLLAVSCNTQNTTELKIGDTVTDFSAMDDQSVNWNSSTITTDFLVVYFYPAAMTGGCTAQACAYRDDKTTLDEMGATVIGVSGDEVSNLKHFKESYNLNFPLLSDTNGNIAKTFGVPTNDGGSITKEFNGATLELTRGVTASRWTFVLDKDRKVIYKNDQVNAAEDSKNVKDILKNYTSN